MFGMYKKIWCRILFLSFIPSMIFGQTATDIKSVENVFPLPAPQPSYETMKPEAKKGEIFWTRLFVFYKRCISSQDGQGCPFHPTCSQFALDAVKKNGPFIGLLAAFDRLNRCNGSRQAHYPIVNGRLHDPVE